MKKSSILVIFSAVLVVVGIVICVVGAANGVSGIISITPEGIHFADDAFQTDFEEFIEKNNLNDLLNVGKGDYLTQLTQLEGSFSTISIDIVDADIEFVFNTSTRFGCEYGYYANAPITITESRDSLIIRQSKNSFFSFGSIPSSGRTFIRIYIPNDHNIRLLTCSTVSSNVRILAPENNTFRTLDINSVSGSIFLRNIDATLVDLQTTSGAIHAQDLKADACEINSVSGNINLDAFCSQLTVGNTSGAINIDRFTSDSVVLNTTSGSIQAKGRANDSIEIESISGDIELTIAERPKTVSLDFQTISGKCNVDVPKDTMTGDSEIHVETLSANLTLNFEHSYIS